jgi:hypothetical protein
MNYIESDGTYTVVIGGRVHTFDADHPNYNVLVDAVNSDKYDVFNDNIDEADSVKKWAEVQDLSTLFPTGFVSSLLNKVRKLIAGGKPADRYKLFVKNLSKNPDKIGIESVYKFVGNHSLPLTDDGCLLAYKYVTVLDDGSFVDTHTQKNSNNVGDVVTMKRKDVDSNPEVSCSTGLHVGGLYYASFGQQCADRDTIIVKVNPRDIVCVPNNEPEKCRVCRYEVVAVYEAPLPDTHAPFDYDSCGDSDWEEDDIHCPECGCDECECDDWEDDYYDYTDEDEWGDR